MKIGRFLESIPLHSLVFTPKEIEYYNKISIRFFLLQFINATYLLSSAYAVWVLLGILCNTESPVVVVLSESMYPGFSRGDILFLKNWERQEAAGDICVFQLDAKDIPIVHRIINRFHMRSKNDELRIMTKGDNNQEDDGFLYRKVGKSYLEKSNIKNFVFATIPWVGMITIWSNTYPSLKILILLLLFIDMLFTRDESNTPLQKSVEKQVAQKDRKTEKTA